MKNIKVIMSVLCSGGKWNYLNKIVKENVTLSWNLKDALKGATLENRGHDKERKASAAVVCYLTSQDIVS